MNFSSISFVALFVITYSLVLIFNSECVCKKLSEKKQLSYKHGILLLASYIFYGWWDFRFCFLMLFLTATAWLCAKNIEENKSRKLFTVIGVVVPLAVLGFFKYFNFFVSSFAALFGIDSAGTLNIILPVGISFYTFQSMSYTIDVLRGKLKSQRFMDVALYISFFPQLVAGPIVKASDFLPQLAKNHKLKLCDLSRGGQIFIIGLFKKLVVADNLSGFVDDVFEKPLAFSSATIVLAVISYSIQIFCDFSGYSDMAIGVAKCFGYDFKPNFNLPYLSKNMTEFWKRWHISLSTWLQEYLYIPLGGNRKGKVRTYINLLLTMVLGGLWHGANYTFVIWGVLHGLALCVHKIWMKVRKNKKPAIMGSAFAVFLTYVFTCICWVFFRAENLTIAIDVLKRMLIWESGISQMYSWSFFAIAVVIGWTIIAVIKSKKSGFNKTEDFYPILDLSKLSGLIIFITFTLFVLCVAYTKANPFIYFQF